MRVRSNQPMVRTNIYLSRPQHAGFRKLARQTGCTASELVRLARPISVSKASLYQGKMKTKRSQYPLSELQKSILEKIAKSPNGFVHVSSLYDPDAPNLNAARAATSRAISRLQDRGLIERQPLVVRGLKRRKLPTIIAAPNKKLTGFGS